MLRNYLGLLTPLESSYIPGCFEYKPISHRSGPKQDHNHEFIAMLNIMFYSESGDQRHVPRSVEKPLCPEESPFLSMKSSFI
jgi:hypothetical protein